MTRRDCFAYNKEKHTCNALDKLYCRNECRCNFFKTKEQFEEGMKKWGYTKPW